MPEAIASSTWFREAMAVCGNVLASHGWIVNVHRIGTSSRTQQVARLEMQDGTRLILKVFTDPDDLSQMQYHAELEMLSLLKEAKMPVPHAVFSNDQQAVVLTKYVGSTSLQERLENSVPDKQMNYMLRACKLLAGIENTLSRGITRLKSFCECNLTLNDDSLEQAAGPIKSEVIPDLLSIAKIEADDKNLARALELIPHILEMMPRSLSLGPADVWPRNIVLDERDRLCLVEFDEITPRPRDWRLLTLIIGYGVSAGVDLSPLDRPKLIDEYYKELNIDIPADEWMKQLDAQIFWQYWVEAGKHLAWITRQRSKYQKSWQEFSQGQPEERYAQMVKNYLDAGYFSKDPIIEEFRNTISVLFNDWIDNTCQRKCFTLNGFSEYMTGKARTWAAKHI